MKHITRRFTLAAAALALLPFGAAAQSYPDRPIRLVVPYTAAGANDAMARIFAAQLAPKLGGTLIVDNRPGASGTIGAASVATAPADGYTLLLGANGVLVVNPLIFPKPGYKADSFVPVGIVGEIPMVLVSSPSLPVNSLQELVAHAKQSPGKLNFASPGRGTQMHLVGELFKSQAGLDITAVTYPGSAPALADVSSGQVQMAFDPVNSALGLIRAGKLRPLAVTGPKRSPSLPDVPTVAEAGMPSIGATAWFSIMAPAGTPAPVMDKLRQALAETLKDPAVHTRLATIGAEAPAATPDQATAYIEQERVRWTRIIQQAGIKGD